MRHGFTKEQIIKNEIKDEFGEMSGLQIMTELWNQ